MCSTEKKKKKEMLSLQLPGKGVRVTVEKIHFCPRKAQKTKKKKGREKKKKRIFFPPGTGEAGYSCWKCCTWTENIADAQVHLKEQHLGKEQGTVERSGFIVNTMIL